MKIVEIAALPNGAHRNQTSTADVLPDGWAIIPEDLDVPKSFPFVELVAEDVEYTRDVQREQEVAKTREVVTYDEDGKEVVTMEEYTEMETVTVQEVYTRLTVTSMTAGVVPDVEAEEPVTQLDRIEAQVTYTAMMTDTLLEEV